MRHSQRNYEYRDVPYRECLLKKSTATNQAPFVLNGPVRELETKYIPEGQLYSGFS